MRMHILWIIAGVLWGIFTGSAWAQPDSAWSHVYGGTGQDRGNSVLPLADGGFLIAGQTSSRGAGADDFWLIRTDADGDSLWSRTYGGDSTDICWSVCSAQDEGYWLSGHSRSFSNGGMDFWLLKVSAEGDSLWSRSFGGEADDGGGRACATQDGGIVMAGQTRSFGLGDQQFWLLKLDASGDSLWSRTYGGVDDESCLSIEQTADSGFVLAGTTESWGAGQRDFWLVKTSANGDSMWSRSYGGESEDLCYCARQTGDGGFVLAGNTESFGAGEYDVWVLKADANGDSLWSRTFGGIHNDYGRSVLETADGGLLVLGFTFCFGYGYGDGWLIKLDANGDSLWSCTFGAPLSDDRFMSVEQTDDYGFVLAGFMTSSEAPDENLWVMKTGPDISPVERREIVLTSGFALDPGFPNPFNSFVTLSYDLSIPARVSLRVFDVLGREVAVVEEGLVEAGRHRVAWGGGNSVSGTYFARLRAGGISQTQKLVLIK